MYKIKQKLNKMSFNMSSKISPVYNETAFILACILTLGIMFPISFVIGTVGIIFVPGYILVNDVKFKDDILLIMCSIIGSITGICVGMYINIEYISQYILQENSSYNSDIQIGRCVMIVISSCIVGISATVIASIYTGIIVCMKIFFGIIITAVMEIKYR